MLLALIASLLVQDKLNVYVGTYTGKTPADSKGIYRFSFDPKTGEASEAAVAAETANPTFLAVHPSGKLLYAAGEIGNFEGKKAGGVSAFAVQPDGSLKLLNAQSSGGPGPCHLVVDKEGKAVLVANYGGGSCEALPIQPDGSLAAPSSFHQHVGTSVDKGRQEAPHAHSINLDAAGRFAFCADLGLDKILVYRFDAAKGTLTPHDPPHAAVPPGSGPRHFAFRPDGKFAYVCGEMTSTVIGYSYDAEKGVLSEIGTVSTLPEPVKGNSTAEVVVHPSGKTLYCSNRGHNSIAVFDIDAASGKLAPKGHVPTGGKTPRNFALDPSGAWLFAANQGSDSVVVFKVDPATGVPAPSGAVVKVSKPVCVRFVKP
jgi:6-phosphogluconolactonase